MSDTKPLDNVVGITTDIFVLLREMCIVILFVLLLVFPLTFQSLLTRIGIKSVPTPFGDIDVADAGGTVSTLDRGLSDSVERLQQIQAKVSDASSKNDIQNVVTYLQGLEDQAQTTDDTIKTTLVAQQAAVAKASPQAAKVSGWLLLGHVGPDKQQWTGTKGPKNVAATLSPVITVGEEFEVTSPAYLRDSAPAEEHKKNKVVGVVTSGQVKVTTLRRTAPPSLAASTSGQRSSRCSRRVALPFRG